jgi:hypothetical protein
MEYLNVNVLKLYNVSFLGRCARRGNTLKLPSPTKLTRLGHFPPASQAGRLAGPVFYVSVFSLTISFITYKFVVYTPCFFSIPICTLWFLAAAVCLGVVFLTLYCLRRFLAKKREEKEKKKKKKSKGPVDLQVSRHTDKKRK